MELDDIKARRKAAEVKKLEAETAKLESEARKAAAEAAIAEERAKEAILDAALAQDADKITRASDDFHRVYRFNGEVSSTSVQQCMKKLIEWDRLDPDCTIEIIFNSPGGSIFDGLALFDLIVELGDKGHKTITGGLGMTASMAGILLMAGQHRWVGNENWMLIHRAAFGAIGQTFEVEDRLELIKRIEERIINIFVTRSGGRMSSQRIKKNWERRDFWLDSRSCLEYGLIDEIRGQL